MKTKSRIFLRKTTEILGWLTVSLCILLPAAKLICAFFERTFDYADYTAASYIYVCALTVLTVVCFIDVLEDVGVGLALRVLFALLPLLALTNAALFMKSFLISDQANATSEIVCITVFLFLSFLPAVLGTPFILRFLVGILAGALVVPYLFFALFALIGVPVNTVVSRETSPGGKYTCEVIYSDQGALGGDTIVKVRKGKPVSLGFAEISGFCHSEYTYEWSYKSRDISWKDGDTLLIDNVEYPLN